MGKREKPIKIKHDRRSLLMAKKEDSISERKHKELGSGEKEKERKAHSHVPIPMLFLAPRR